MRGPVRRWVGPRIGYLLWALPALRIAMPPLPAGSFAAMPLPAAAGSAVLAVGSAGSGLWQGPSASSWPGGPVVLAIWLAGAAGLFAALALRHARFRRRLLAAATTLGRQGGIRIIAAGVDGPLTFGLFRRYVAVPRDFAQRYTPHEQQLAIAHECAHHARGDLAANWASLVMLALHWWNPIAWAAVGAFRQDQEFAVDAHVLARCEPKARPAYAGTLAKAAGLGALPVSNLTVRANLKGRLTMIAKAPVSTRRTILGGSALAIAAAVAFAATASVSSTAAAAGGRQAVTIGVKPDGAGGYALIVGGVPVAPGAPLPGGATLPADFDTAGGCNLKPSAKPTAMAIKGTGGTQTYTILCASAAPAPVRTSLVEGLASLKTMRASVATQPASAAFPETERTHALGAIDRSIREVEATLAKHG